MNKTWYQLILYFLLLFPILIILMCKKPRDVIVAVSPEPLKDTTAFSLQQPDLNDSILFVIKLVKNVKIKDYFTFIDRQVSHYDSLVPYKLTEHLLVGANPWIINRLVATDYYTMMERDSFVFDQKELSILHNGDSLLIPDTTWANLLKVKQSQTLIDINIPEFSLWILEGGKELYRFPIRVGQNRERFLKTANRIENLRTRTGSGQIVKITRDPTYMNPVDGHQYESTARDDGRRTKLPQIPFLHPEINGHRWGQLIHPTTNAETLGKAYSNGCIGTGEGAAWRIYYHAPVGTKVRIRYDLEVVNEVGDTLNFKNIYMPIKKVRKPVLGEEIS